MKEPMTKAARVLAAQSADKDCPSCKGRGGWDCDCEASLCLHRNYWVTCKCVLARLLTAPTPGPKEDK